MASFLLEISPWAATPPAHPIPLSLTSAFLSFQNPMLSQICSSNPAFVCQCNLFTIGRGGKCISFRARLKLLLHLILSLDYQGPGKRFGNPETKSTGCQERNSTHKRIQQKYPGLVRPWVGTAYLSILPLNCPSAWHTHMNQFAPHQNLGKVNNQCQAFWQGRQCWVPLEHTVLDDLVARVSGP